MLTSIKKLKPWLLAALLFPILSLMLLSQIKKEQLEQGVFLTFPIVGFDPRDLLSGHYLIYRVDYGVKNVCDDKYKGEAMICMKPSRYFYPAPIPPASCHTYLTGSCSTGQFKAGIERFYIPEAHAGILDQLIRGKQGKIVVSITDRGNAVIKDLLINDEPWLTALENLQQDKQEK